MGGPGGLKSEGLNETLCGVWATPGEADSVEGRHRSACTISDTRLGNSGSEEEEVKEEEDDEEDDSDEDNRLTAGDTVPMSPAPATSSASMGHSNRLS